MQAVCNNPDCDKDPWTLRKHPDEYAGGGPSCPDCGSTRVEVVADQGGQAPARQEQSADLPAAEMGTDEEIAARGGMAASKAAYAYLGEHDDEQELSLFREALQDGVDAVTGLWRRQKEKKRTAERVELGEGEQVYPTCQNCGRVFKRIDPEAKSVRCNNCGTEYPIVERT